MEANECSLQQLFNAIWWPQRDFFFFFFNNKAKEEDHIIQWWMMGLSYWAIHKLTSSSWKAWTRARWQFRHLFSPPLPGRLPFSFLSFCPFFSLQVRRRMPHRRLHHQNGGLLPFPSSGRFAVGNRNVSASEPKNQRAPCRVRSWQPCR